MAEICRMGQTRSIRLHGCIHCGVQGFAASSFELQSFAWQVRLQLPVYLEPICNLSKPPLFTSFKSFKRSNLTLFCAVTRATWRKIERWLWHMSNPSNWLLIASCCNANRPATMSVLDSPERASSGEKHEATRDRRMSEVPSPTGWSSWFGGKNVTVGPRIGPVLTSISGGEASDTDESGLAILDKQLAAESGSTIQYRTCSWQKTAALLFSEYICLAIMSFPWSYSVLGLVPG
jgi:hypothetical protein